MASPDRRQYGWPAPKARAMPIVGVLGVLEDFHVVLVDGFMQQDIVDKALDPVRIMTALLHVRMRATDEAGTDANLEPTPNPDAGEVSPYVRGVMGSARRR